MLKPTVPVDTDSIKQSFSLVGSSLNISLLEKLRKYLTICRHNSFEVSDETQHQIQEDFVNERNRADLGPNEQRMTGEDLHRLLVIRFLHLTG